MDASTLRERQSPLKQQYRADPASALVTLRAQGALRPEAVRCDVASELGPVPAGLHPATGGDGHEACSGEMLLQALVGCAGVTCLAVANAMKLPLRGGTVRAAGEWDARGTLAVDAAAPVGFRRIALEFDLELEAPPEQKAKLLELTERYCVVLQTIRRGPEVTSRLG